MNEQVTEYEMGSGSSCLGIYGSRVLCFCPQTGYASIDVLGQHLWEMNSRCPREDLSQKLSLYGHLTDGKIESQSGKDLL